MSDPHTPNNTDIQANAPPGHTAVASDPHGQAGTAALPFSPEEWHEFHESDKGAGGAIIVLMGSIFTIGLVLYSIIAFVVAE